MNSERTVPPIIKAMGLIQIMKRVRQQRLIRNEALTQQGDLDDTHVHHAIHLIHKVNEFQEEFKTL